MCEQEEELQVREVVEEQSEQEELAANNVQNCL